MGDRRTLSRPDWWCPAWLVNSLPVLVVCCLLPFAASTAALGQASGGATGWTTELAPSRPPSPPAASPPRKPAAQPRPEPPSSKAARARATAAVVEQSGQRTRFKLAVTRPVTANVYALSNPYRVIADLPDLDFILPAGTGRRAQGAVSAFRYGLFEIGRSRIVFDVAGPVEIDGVRFEPSADGGGHLQFDLVPTTPERFGAAEQAKRQPGLRESRFDDPVTPAGPKTRRVVMIDPGHGGPDPGTVAGPRLSEKDIVLAVGRQLHALLAAGRRYDVHMTRDKDVFVSLDDRLRRSRSVAADLFISLHIDALAEAGFAQNVRGASIYILSERASDDASRRLADKENASDVLAGLDVASNSDEDQVRSILFDLIRRETANHSAEFRNLLTSRLGGRMTLAREPQRAAAFKVLKQSETPSVLVELGYMSHAEDRSLIVKSEWQRQVAAAIAEAVDAYFTMREAKARP